MLITYFMFFILPISVDASVDSPWKKEADYARTYFERKDYNAAWLFYERVLKMGCDDGVIMFCVAESFRHQDLVEDPEYTSALYAVTHHYLQKQSPNHPAIQSTLAFFPPDTIVNRAYIKKVYQKIGGSPPPSPMVREGIESVREFISHNVENFTQLLSIAGSDGVYAAWLWAKPRIWELLLFYFLVILLTGILLPLVMAVAVSIEGRKSYVTAYALLLHWGILGLHRFYLGKKKTGLIWLFTGGLLGFGVLFDIFLTGAYVRFWNEDNKEKRSLTHTSREKSSQMRSNRGLRELKPSKKTDQILAHQTSSQSSEEYYPSSEFVSDQIDSTDNEDVFDTLPDLGFDDGFSDSLEDESGDSKKEASPNSGMHNI